RENDQVRLVALDLTLAFHDRRADGGAAELRLEPDRLGVRQQLDVRMLECRPDAQYLRVGLAMDGTRKAVAVRTAHAGAVRRAELVQPNPARGVARLVPRGRQGVR